MLFFLFFLFAINFLFIYIESRFTKKVEKTKIKRIKNKIILKLLSFSSLLKKKKKKKKI